MPEPQLDLGPMPSVREDPLNIRGTTSALEPVRQVESAISLEQGTKIPTWKQALADIDYFNDAASNSELYGFIREKETVLQQAIEDPAQFLEVFTGFCSSIEPFPEKEDPLGVMKIRKFKADFVKKNLGLVEKFLDGNPQWDTADVIERMGGFMKEDYAEFAGPMMDFFIKNYDFGSGYWNNRDFFSFVFQYGKMEQRKWAFEEVKSQISDPGLQSSQNKASRLGHLAGVLDYQNDPLSNEARDLFTDELSRYGLESDELLDMWAESKGNRHRSEVIEENIRTIITLEAVRPGIARVLWTEYGIADFGRYPINLLVWQFDNKDNSEVPYGVMVYPQADHNGAFYQDKEKFLGLFVELQDLGYGLRVFEAGSSEDLIRALITSDKRFGEKNKISFAILGGHGSKESIQFGNGKKGLLNIGEIIGRGASSLGRQLPKIKRMFVKNPSIVLFSCTTGEDTGIGHELSVFGAKVVGPKSLTYVESIHAKKNERGNLDFDVSYWNTPNGTFMRGEVLE